MYDRELEERDIRSLWLHSYEKKAKKDPAFQPGNYRMVALTGFEPVTCRV